MGNLWIFDFDGTLVDSEVAIRRCYLKVTKKLIPERLNFAKKILIGPTLEETTSMILTDKKLHLKEDFMQNFQNEYDEKTVLDTPMYPNVDSVLRELKNKNNSLSILTNKRFKPTYKLIEHFKWANLFDWIACADMFPEQKNKIEVLNKQKISWESYKDIYLVGDTTSDGMAAKSKNMKFIKANYGYGNKQSWKKIPIYKSISDFSELLELF